MRVIMAVFMMVVIGTTENQRAESVDNQPDHCHLNGAIECDCDWIKETTDALAGHRQRTRQFTHRPMPPNSMNQSNTHAGMLNPRNIQFTFAHSPEPVKTIANVSFNGKTSNMYDRLGPHSGT